MTVVVHCKRCRKELRAQDRYAGMPTRCPRCGTLNQLPGLETASEGPAPPNVRARPLAATADNEPAAETCKICGKRIRGKAERFADVHGTLYHLGCYQKQAGDASENTCRICHKGFDTPKERVKDVVGFCYHRKCYQEELERQRRAAAGAESGSDSGPPAKGRSAGEPHRPSASDVDDWDLTPEDEDDWNLTEEVSDDWMRPDPGELELREAPSPSPANKPAVKPEAKPIAQATGPAAPASTPEAKLRRPAADSAASPTGASGAKPAASPERPAPRAEAVSKSVPPTAERAQPASGPAAAKGAAPPDRSSNAAGREKSPRPAAGSGPAAGAKGPRKDPKPLRRAKPIGERPVAAPPSLPEGLELVADEPEELAGGLEILPDKPGIVEGLEILEDSAVAAAAQRRLPAPAVPAAHVIPGAPAAPAVPAASMVPAVLVAPAALGPLGNLGGLESLDGPMALRPIQMPTPGGGSANPLPGILLDPLTGEPSGLGYRRARRDNPIPTWLWALMGVGVGVVVIMLAATVINVVWNSRSAGEPVAQSEGTGTDESGSGTDETYSSSGEEPLGSQAEPLGGGEQRPVEAGEDRAPASDGAPDSLWAKYQELREKTKRSGGGMGPVVFGAMVSLAIYLGVSALALQLACKMCGEPDVTGLRIVGICCAQMVAGFVIGLTTATLSSATAGLISLPLALAASTVLVRFLLPTSTGRAIGIAVCHVIMCAVVAVVLVFVVAFVLIMLIAGTR